MNKKFLLRKNEEIQEVIKKSKKDGNNKISLDKLVSIANNMDIKVTLTLEDKNKNIPNPMNDKIVVQLTSEEEEWCYESIRIYSILQ